MKLYRAFLKAFNDQFESGNTSTEGLPLKQVQELMLAKMFMDQPSKFEASYGFGWGRVELPGRMSQIGLNPETTPEGMPIVSKGVPSRLVVSHQGSLPGALILVVLLPDTESAIVIQANALALNDVPNWVGQMVLEEFLEVPASERNDCVTAATTSRATNLEWYPALVKELQHAQKINTSPHKIESYTGSYWDALHIVKIVVTVENDDLFWALQGLESEKFQLMHYQDSIFTWLRPRNELSRRGRWVGIDQVPAFWKLEFKVDSDDKPDRLY